MGRKARAAVGGWAYHVINRGNRRMRVFGHDGDYRAFLQAMADGLQVVPMRILGWCLMPNHWHLVLWPRNAAGLSDFFRWVCTTHVRRWRTHRHNGGEGHLYQGRFKSFPIQRDEHLRQAVRYVEANPRRARLVKRAEDWPYSSLWSGERPEESCVQLEEGWVSRDGKWLAWVNAGASAEELGELRVSVNRGRPYGGKRWTAGAAARMGLESTLRSPGRPRKMGG